MKIVQITREFVEDNIDHLLDIEKTVTEERWAADNFLMELESKWDYSFAAVDDDRIVAFLVCSVKGANLHIHRIVVLPEYRGHGLGLEMMERVFAGCPAANLRSMTLKVHESNLDAQRFYERMGFRRVAVEDVRYIYRKTL